MDIAEILMEFNTQQPVQVWEGHQDMNFDRNKDVTVAEMKDNAFQPSNQESGFQPCNQESGFQPSNYVSGFQPSNQESGFQPSTQENGFQPSDQESGFQPNDKESGFQPGDQESGFQPGDQESGFQPDDKESGFQSGDQESGFQPGVKESRFQPGDQESGFQPGGQESGFQSDNKESGFHPGDQESGFQSSDKSIGNDKDILDNETSVQGKNVDKSKSLCCHICGKIFRFKCLLDRHMTAHTREKLFVCAICGAEFCRKGRLFKHVAIHLKELNRREESERTGNSDVENEPAIKEEYSEITRTENEKAIEGIDNYKRRYKCQHCNKAFKFKCLLQRHLTIHNKEKNFYCSFCWKGFNRKDNCAKHIKLHFKENSILYSYEAATGKIPLNNTEQVDFVSLCMKNENKRDDNPWKMYLDIDGLVQHLKSTEERIKNRGQHRCKVCQKVFKYECQLTRHQAVHTGEKSFLCALCGKGFSRKDHYLKHIKKHNKKKNKSASISDGSTMNLDFDESGENQGLMDNTESFNDISDNDTEKFDIETIGIELDGDKKGQYKCRTCDKVLKSKYKLQRHQIVHNAKRKFSCSFCGRSYNRKDNLQKHLKEHRKDKYSSAPGATSSNKIESMKVDDGKKGELVNISNETNVFGETVKPIKQNRGVKKNVCSSRGKRLKQKRLFVKHLELQKKGSNIEKDATAESISSLNLKNEFDKETNEKENLEETINNAEQNECQVCEKVFKSKYKLQRHQAVHSGKKRFSCSFCGRSYSREDNLKKHMKEHKNVTSSSVSIVTSNDKNGTVLDSENECGNKIVDEDAQSVMDSVIDTTPELDFQESKVNEDRKKVDNAGNGELMTFDDETNVGKVNTRPVRCRKSKKKFKFEEEGNEKEDLEERKKLNNAGNGELMTFDDETSVGKVNTRPVRCRKSKKKFKFEEEGNEKEDLEETVNNEAQNECQICKKIFKSKYKLQRHKIVHSRKNNFNCSFCGRNYTREDNLKKHMKEHMNSTSSSASIVTSNDKNSPVLDSVSECGNEIVDEDNQSVMDNAINTTPDLDFQNLEESEGITKVDNGRDGELINFADEDTVEEENIEHIKCNNTVMKNKSEENRNEKENLEETVYNEAHNECPICKKVFKSKFKLKRHQVVHSGKKNFCCLFCGRSYNREDNLKAHVKEHVTDTSSVHDVTSDDKNERNGITNETSVGGKNVKAIKKQKGGKNVCLQCGISFKQRTLLVRHLKFHRKNNITEKGEKISNQEQYECEICKKVFKSRYKLQRHQVVHSGKRNFCCSFCGRCYNRKDNLAKHVKEHTSETIQKLDLTHGSEITIDEGVAIDKTSDSGQHVADIERRRLQRFKRKQRNRGKEGDSGLTTLEDSVDEKRKNKGHHKCQTCNKVFKFRCLLKRHQAMHNGERNFHCSLCAKSFRRKDHLDKHTKLHCKKIKFPSDEGTSDKMNLTNDSGSEFDDSDLERYGGYQKEDDDKEVYLDLIALAKHEKSAEKRIKNKGHHKCRICKKVFMYRCNLQRHQLVHTGSSNFLCSFCGKSFSRNDRFAAHVKQHNTSVGVLSADTTSMNANTGHNLKPIKSHICPFCFLEFRFKSELTRHLCTHTKERNFGCSICGKKFTQKSRLLIHLRLHKKKYNLFRLTTKRASEQVNWNNSYYENDKAALETAGTEGEQMKLDKTYFDLMDLFIAQENEERAIKEAAIASGQFECQFCKKVFKEKHKMLRHQTIHTRSQSYLCSFCGSRFNRKDNLAQHVKRSCKGADQHVIVNNEPQSEIINLDQQVAVHNTFDRTAEMNTHQGMISIVIDRALEEFYQEVDVADTVEEVTYGERSSESVVVEKEIKVEKKGKGKKVATAKQVKNHKCTYCDKLFQYRYELNLHLPAHTKEKNFVCSLCGKGFSRKTRLYKHVRTHKNNITDTSVNEISEDQGLENYLGFKEEYVDENGKTFLDVVDLIRFEKSTEIRLKNKGHHECEICHKVFKFKHQLNRHQIIHTKEKSFLCPLCGKGYSRRDKCMQHIKRHDTETTKASQSISGQYSEESKIIAPGYG